MNISIKLLLASLFLSFSSGAFAGCPQAVEDEYEDDEEDCVQVRAYNYIGVKGGPNNVYSGDVTSGAATALGITIGQRYNDLFSGEFEYVSLANYTTGLASFKADAFNIAAVHTFQMTDSLGLYGRLGVAYTRVNNSGFSTRFGRTDMTYGAGLEWTINKDIIIRASYDHYSLDMDGAGTIVGDGLTAMSFLYKY